MYQPNETLFLFMTNNQTDNYKTRDLAEAATLIVKGQQFLTILREGNICWFVFGNKDVCEQLSNQYYYSEVLVNARAFHEACSRLKGRVFAKE